MYTESSVGLTSTVSFHSNTSAINDEINTEILISTEKNKNRLEAEIAANKEVMSRIAEVQSELLNTAIEKWRKEELEKIVVSLLKPSRVAHVLGCRDTAVELARRWGADETDAARAGILHDVTKALYTCITVFLCSQVIDAVVYRFDYSKVALIISSEYEAIARIKPQYPDAIIIKVEKR